MHDPTDADADSVTRCRRDLDVYYDGKLAATYQGAHAHVDATVSLDVDETAENPVTLREVGVNVVDVNATSPFDFGFFGSATGVNCRILADTGCTAPGSAGVVDATFLRSAGLHYEPVPAAGTCSGYNGSSASVLGTVKLNLKLQGFREQLTFCVVEMGGAHDVILSQEFLREHHAVLHSWNRTLTLRRNERTYVVHGSGSAPPAQSSRGPVQVGVTKIQQHLSDSSFMLYVSAISVNEPGSPDPQIDALLSEYDSIFKDKLPAGDADRPGGDAGMRIHIRSEHAQETPHSAPHRAFGERRAEIERIVNELLRDKKIDPCASPYGAPVLFAPKADGSLRFCIDYRALNNITVRDRHPLPHITELLDSLGGAKVFSTLDLTSGYWQVPVHPEDRAKTAFVTHLGQYEWRVVPFGLTNAPAEFQRRMNTLLHGLIGKCVVVYLDDILVYSRNAADHLRDLKLVLDRLQAGNWYLKRKKCHFNAQSLKFLGHIVSADGVSPDPAKVQVLSDWPRPTTVKGVRSFLGLANFFRRYVHNHTRNCRRLHRLTKDGVPWEWGDAEQAAFDTVKGSLSADTLLAMPDPALPFEVVADASDYAVGAVLMQQGRPIAFEGRVMVGGELTWGVGEKELLAVVHALRVWRSYLLSSPHQFTVSTDHNPNTFFQTKKNLSQRQARWSEELSAYNFRWEYLKGKLNKADPVSRAPQFQIAVTEVHRVINTVSARVLAATSATDTPTASPPAHCCAAIVTPAASTPSPILNAASSSAPNAAPAAAPATANADTAYPDTPTDAELLFPNFSSLERDFGRSLRDRMISHSGNAWFSNNKHRNGWTLRNGLWVTASDQVVVPPDTDLRHDVLLCLHDDTMGAHMGVERTYNTVKVRYYWPGLYRDVAQFVRLCPSCGEQKQSRAGKAPVDAIQSPGHRWHTITCDLITKLPPTSRGHDSIVVFVDKFSKMTHLVPISEAGLTASGLFDILVKDIFRLHGLPTAIISDRDTRFTSGLWQEVTNLLNINHKFSTAYHPQTDGQTERQNDVIESALRHYVTDSCDNWDKFLAPVEFAINNSYSKAIGTTPFYLNTAQHPRMPGDIRPNPAARVPHANEIVAETKRVILRARQYVYEAQRRYSSATAVIPSFAQGDSVWLSTRNFRKSLTGGKKLAPRYAGPYKVLRKVGKRAYTLDLPSKSRVHPTFHVDLLKACYAEAAKVRPIAEAMPFSEDDNVCAVERILAHRSQGSSRAYKIRWAGYGQEHDEWVKGKHVTPDLVKDYEQTPEYREIEQVLVLSREKAQAAKTARAAPAQPPPSGVRRSVRLQLNALVCETEGDPTANHGSYLCWPAEATSDLLVDSESLEVLPDANITRYNAFKTRDWQIGVHALVIQRLDLD
jgi:hypothetical protein